VSLAAPFASPRYTLSVSVPESGAIKRVAVRAAGQEGPLELKEVDQALKLVPGTWHRGRGGVLACFDLPRGQSTLELL
jgi:hypothetical protein